jgi:hypothetical protein
MAEESRWTQVRFVAVVRFLAGSLSLSFVALVSGIWWLAPLGVVAGLVASISLLISWRTDPKRLERAGWRW